ncbi:hypothetical protein AOCH_004128 [Aspergillus ochraceoroseus]|uniref:Zn(2)-C6 fungal-type domain-containing protein n=1 Tax=Aspergillus ochraceoroseus TaxID=138278 RepID=A0A0F8V6S2_9EURO|nr:hypothetical protein AOCH_004128 [Aspergillus ochraceoroseus]
MRGCLTCRQRHLKCDKTGTECLRCQRSGRQCIPVPVKPEEVTFRHGQNPSLRSRGPPRYGESDLFFPDDQVWVEVSGDGASAHLSVEPRDTENCREGMAVLSFEDETERTAADYRIVLSSSSPVALREPLEGRPSTAMAALPSATGSHPAFSSGSSASSRVLSESRTRSFSSFTPPSSSSDRPKLADFNEAFLLRHFQKALGPWLDVCDHERQFSTDVVERAPSYPLLLYACLATAARHLSHTTNLIPPNTADEYHERCIAILLPGLENWETKIGIDILLASTIILRFFEQISSHAPSSDLQRHLLAGSVYISSQVECAVSGGLAEASFWVFVMQDIQFALSCRNPLRLTLSPFDEKLQHMWAHKVPQTDRDWTHRAIWLLAETINYCYSVNNPIHTNATRRNLLKQKLAVWEARKPDGFRPLHFSLADPRIGRPYPVVWFTQSLYASAMQHVCMAKALIHEYELRTIYTISNPNHEGKRIEGELMKSLDIIFGIALSSDDDPSARIMACHALCACGTWVRDPLAQRCLLDLLRKTEAENGWPWAFVVQKLSQEWHLTAR